MQYVQNTFLEGKFMCAQSFLVSAHLMTCVHSLEGTLASGPPQCFRYSPKTGCTLTSWPRSLDVAHC